MDKLALSSSLADLESSDLRPKAIQFREIYPEVEKALSSGASYSQVLEAINKHSTLALTPHTFRGYLARTRKRFKSVPAPTPALAPAPAPIPAQLHPSASSLIKASLPEPHIHSGSSQRKESITAEKPQRSPFDRSDPRTLDRAINTRRNLDELAAIGRATQKAQKE